MNEVNYQVMDVSGKRYIELLPGGELLASERAAVDLVGICGENETDLLLLPGETLSPDFFNLRTRLAGEILLKFTTYRIRAAAVLTREQVGDGRFKEMVDETNRGSQFRVFYDHEAAEEWLLKAGK